jgi:hypothetical protein
MTKAQLTARVAELEEELDQESRLVERLQDEVDEREDVGGRFIALCQALDDHRSLRDLPIRMRLDMEALAELLGVVRCW